MDVLAHWREAADAVVAVSLVPLALWILLSGLDDLFILVAWLLGVRFQPKPVREPDHTVRRKAIAIFVPLWREHAVIGQMLEHNTAALDYDNYDIFVGLYPNDPETRAVVAALEAAYPNVHSCLCPHDGPTSKADCLNWIYQRMILHERESGRRYEIIVCHDAEDLIHSQSLRWLNHFCDRFGMVPLPVLPLPTSFRRLTHGIYCDDFAEFHAKDLPVRHLLGGFVPSCGVGTGYARWALEKLAAAESNRVFDPASLTEDYENGYRLHWLGVPQLFVPLVGEDGMPIATREYFPQRFRHALKQRTRWVTGIALQGWQRHRWGGGLGRAYWFWRDRKGLAGNPLSLVANLFCLYGLSTQLWARLHPGPWEAALVAATTALFVTQLAARFYFSARVYGGWFALGVPLRILHGNLLNSAATVNALMRYAKARLLRQPLVWVKTDHAYPTLAALAPHKRPLCEVLAGSGYVDRDALEKALAAKPLEEEVGAYLVRIGLLSQEDLREALCLQQHLAGGQVELEEVIPRIARALPAHLIECWKVMPIRVAAGSLHLAVTQPPTDALEAELARFTRLGLRFHLVTPGNFEQLEARFLK